VAFVVFMGEDVMHARIPSFTRYGMLAGAFVMLLVAGMAFAAPVSALGNSIYRITGNNIPNNAGDGGFAINAQVELPDGLAFDDLGDLYIADPEAAVIRKIDVLGIITTVAGNGTKGYSGDGSAAISASLYWPEALAYHDGCLYIADLGNNRVRRVNLATGIIDTFAGNGSQGFSGDGGQATSAQLKFPAALAFNANGVLYIADAGNQRVREVDLDGIISTVAGNGAEGSGGNDVPATSTALADPSGLAVNPRNGNLYIADTAEDTVRYIDSAGYIHIAAGTANVKGHAGNGGLAVSALLNEPHNLAFDSAGNLYIADTQNSQIRKVDGDGNIWLVAGLASAAAGYNGGDGGSARAAQLHFPASVAVSPAGDVFLSDTFNFMVRKVGLLPGILTP
jgi:DNA-binding beta-propeller fold protein YncE